MSERVIAVEVAQVYRGGGRRYFTLLSAARATARAAIKERCECEEDDSATAYPGYTCAYHRDPQAYVDLRDRYARLLMRKFRGSGE